MEPLKKRGLYVCRIPLEQAPIAVDFQELEAMLPAGCRLDYDRHTEKPVRYTITEKHIVISCYYVSQ